MAYVLNVPCVPSSVIVVLGPLHLFVVVKLRLSVCLIACLSVRHLHVCLYVNLFGYLFAAFFICLVNCFVDGGLSFVAPNLRHASKQNIWLEGIVCDNQAYDEHTHR